MTNPRLQRLSEHLRGLACHGLGPAGELVAPVSTEYLQRYVRQRGGALPDDYSEFLLGLGGCKLFAVSSKTQPSVPINVLFGESNKAHLDLIEVQADEGALFPPEVAIIGGDAFGNRIVLCCREPDWKPAPLSIGEVGFWMYHESVVPEMFEGSPPDGWQWQSIVKVGGSFTEFVLSLFQEPD